MRIMDSKTMRHESYIGLDGATSVLQRIWMHGIETRCVGSLEVKAEAIRLQRYSYLSVSEPERQDVLDG